MRIKNIALLLAVTATLVFVSCAGGQTQVQPVAPKPTAETVVPPPSVDVPATVEQTGDAVLRSVDTHLGGYYGYDISGQNHTRSQVRVSVVSNPSLYGTTIKVIDLTDACSDKNIPYASVLFGKVSLEGNWLFIPAEGCQVNGVNFGVARDDGQRRYISSANIDPWQVGFEALINEPSRILGSVPMGENNNIVFDAKGVKEFAVFVLKGMRVFPYDRGMVFFYSIDPPPVVTLIWADDIISK
jgi:hypothetical protein